MNLVNRYCIACGLVILILASASIALYQRYRYLSSLHKAAVYSSSEAAYAERAVALWSRFNGEPQEQIKKSRLPVAIKFDSKTCIQLKTIPGQLGGIGGNPVYCFDNESEKLVYKSETVD